MATRIIDLLGQGEDNPFNKVLIKQFDANPLLRVFPMKILKAFDYKIPRLKDLPSVGTRGINGAYTESSAKTDWVSFPLNIIGGDIDIDSMLIDIDPNIENQQLMAKLEAYTNKMAKYVLKGDSTAGITGIQTFIQNEYNTYNREQIVNAGGVTTGYAVTVTAAFIRFFEDLDRMIMKCSKSNSAQKIIIMGEDMILLFIKAARALNVPYSPTRDFFAPIDYMYKGIPIIWAGVDDTNTEILGFTETSPDGITKTDCGSILCVALEENTETTLLMSGNPTMRRLGEITEKPVVRYRIDTLAGVALHKYNSATWLRGIRKDA